VFLFGDCSRTLALAFRSIQVVEIPFYVSTELWTLAQDRQGALVPLDLQAIQFLDGLGDSVDWHTSLLVFQGYAPGLLLSGQCVGDTELRAVKLAALPQTTDGPLALV